MKMIKMALLGGAALAVTAGVARADDLADLKAQVEALNARVAQMEAAPSVPAGYNLLSLGEGQATVVPGMTREEQASFAGPVNTISVLPTADAPAAASIEWSGYVRAILGYQVHSIDGADDEDDTDIFARGRLNVTAKTDTAVGEVGVRMRIEGNSPFAGLADLAVDMPVAWGWWAMTPELTLGGGYQGSLGNIGFGYDGACTCHFTDNADVYGNPGDTTQMRLTYASGPMSFAIALEDASYAGNTEADRGLGAAAEIAYAGDSFSGEISGVWRATDDQNSDDLWQVGAGIGFSLDPVSLSLAGGVGHTPGDVDYWFVNALAAVSLSDEIRMELGAGFKSYEDVQDVMGVMGGIYYVPVDQLTIGLEAELVTTDVDGGADLDDVYVGLVTVYSF